MADIHERSSDAIGAGATGGEILVTPEMVEAGYRAMSGMAHLADGDSITEIVSEVYRAMETARRTSTATLPS
jgi:hypothetical protein